MRFLVTGEWIEVHTLVSLEERTRLIEQAVIPSLELWVKWEDEGRIHGGVFAGERAGAFILDAESPEEAGELLATMPFWGLIKWSVRPLQSVQSTLEREHRIIQQARQLQLQLERITAQREG